MVGIISTFATKVIGPDDLAHEEWKLGLVEEHVDSWANRPVWFPARAGLHRTGRAKPSLARLP